VDDDAALGTDDADSNTELLLDATCSQTRVHSRKCALRIARRSIELKTHI